MQFFEDRIRFFWPNPPIFWLIFRCGFTKTASDTK
ncbi:hypothetical protein BVRB_8g186590 [Beta vulgaris subsp. vulgaris]|uniref:Uncharacterized protein n=1 Tax=Beta vulgaris subsp. vulgaris TaxID=3555 RepID=A0A0J8BSD6_BETVV|nr:hypothetical protein BVRB_8g186590 [Beta vulgaris subsp. vulgaris]